MDVTVEYKHKNFLFNKNNQSAAGYACFVKKIVVNNPTSDKINIINVTPIENLNNIDGGLEREIVGLTIRNETQLQKFPRGFGKIFPNLKYFEIDNSSITVLTKEDFLYLEHLQGLFLPRNPIVALPNDLFVNVQGLRYLSFFKNKLKYVGADVLKPLKNLVSANFQENTTIDFNFNGEQGQLALLNQEIATKCIPLSSIKQESSSNKSKVSELEARVAVLENDVKRLKSDNLLLSARLSQNMASQQMLEALMQRVSDLENV